MRQDKNEKNNAQKIKVDSYLAPIRSKTCRKLSLNNKPSSPQFYKGEKNEQ